MSTKNPSPSTIESFIESAHHIDPEWKYLTGLPEWVAWLGNHTLGMMEMYCESLKEPAKSKEQHLIATLRTGLIKHLQLKQVEAIRYPLLMWLLQQKLPETISDIPGTDETRAILIKIATFRKRQESGAAEHKVHSREWDALTMRVKDANFMASRTHTGENRRGLLAVLSAADYAAAEENPQTIANMVRYFVNAMECKKLGSSNLVYWDIANQLMHFLAEAPEVEKPIATSPSLLEKLGTYNPVTDHVAATRE